MAPEVGERALGDRTLISLVSNYAELMKLRVTMLVVATSWCGFFMGALKSEVPALSAQLLETLLGIGLVSGGAAALRSEEHTSELQSRSDLVCRLLLEKKKKRKT